MSWSTIESDPGVFTELIEKYGAKNMQVEELYSVDQLSPEALQTDIYGLIFLFKYEAPEERRQRQPNDDGYKQEIEDSRIFFANQVINNACATQAILHVLFNAPQIELGDTLENFRSFTQDFPPQLRGEAMNESDELRTAHNSFARPEPFVIEQSNSGSSEDTYHYVAYVPFGNRVIELDGLCSGPMLIGTVGEGQSWTDIAKEAIQRRMQEFALGEIRFNLLAICKDKRKAFQEGIQRLQESSGNSAGRISELERAIDEENRKREQWNMENKLRKHNFLPFNMEILRILAEEKRLQPMYETALEQEKQVRESAHAKKRASQSQ